MAQETDNAFFYTKDNWFYGREASRGPWNAEACHAGPVSGVLAGALEKVVPDKQLTRLTINFLRPVPMSGFRVAAEIAKAGRTASTAIATLHDADGRICADASCLLLSTHTFGQFPTASIPHPTFEDAEPGHFPVQHAIHDLPFFGNCIEVAHPPDTTDGHGTTTMWMRAPPIVAGEESSAFQSLCPLADCGNGIARNAEFTEASFVNPDLTVVVYRLPVSDWLASEAISFWEPSGIGMSQATLFDTHGALGTALQSLIVRPV